ncbi:MAG: glycerol-3-phosphate dehydrogenase/oxidase [Candidatus Riflebacteria bacterium]|nr:glycerol-3-phosphate dehydrogenase/oxidase [Candidatus Riflebacteria bacterium]
MRLRESNIERLTQGTFDALVVGGGINGAVSAAALSGQGAKVALIDRGDFAGFTSQESSNLAWGGIKYLETWEFGLVRKLCMSRNRMMRHYPSRVREIRFLAVIDRGFRYHPAFLWMGTWLYWLIGNCFTRIPRLKSVSDIQAEEPILNVDGCAGGFEYSDAYLHDNDSRLVFNFIRSALNMGCVATNYVESLGARRGDDGTWRVQARDTIDGRSYEIRSKVLINAAGPFVDAHNRLTGQKTQHRHVLSKGIHLIVDKLTPNRRVLAFFADDGRLSFIIPLGVRTCIGSTDTRVESPVTHITDDDRAFVLDNINKRLKLPRPLTTDDIVAERCGVRPLAVRGESGRDTDWMLLSRKHVIEMNRPDAHISIFGGKLTDCINVGEEVSELVRQLGIAMPYWGQKWYGEPHPSIHEDFLHRARLLDLDRYTSPASSEPLSSRLWRRYGARALDLLEDIREDPRQAELLIKGTEYIRCEIKQAMHSEMIAKLEDFLRRRSKIALVARKNDIRNAPGLFEACEILFGDKAREKFDEYFRE